MHILKTVAIVAFGRAVKVANPIPCTETCQNCVSNGHLTNLGCEGCPRHPNRWPCNLKDYCRCDDNRLALNCSYAASRTPDRTNSDCVKLCKNVVDHGVMSLEDFRQECSIEFVKTTARDKFIDLTKAPCFDTFIHGHDESSQVINGLFEIGFVTENDMQTPHQCQEACQLVDGCERFIWRWKTERTAKRGRCLLKNAKLVNTAGSIIIDFKHPENMDYKYCDESTVERCRNQTKCIGCPEPRCIWESDYHISGPQYCNAPSLCPIEVTTVRPVVSGPSSRPASKTADAIEESTRLGTANVAPASMDVSAETAALPATYFTTVDATSVAMAAESHASGENTVVVQTNGATSATETVGAPQTVSTVAGAITPGGLTETETEPRTSVRSSEASESLQDPEGARSDLTLPGSTLDIHVTEQFTEGDATDTDATMVGPALTVTNPVVPGASLPGITEIESTIGGGVTVPDDTTASESFLPTNAPSRPPTEPHAECNCNQTDRGDYCGCRRDIHVEVKVDV